MVIRDRDAKAIATHGNKPNENKDKRFLRVMQQ